MVNRTGFGNGDYSTLKSINASKAHALDWENMNIDTLGNDWE